MALVEGLVGADLKNVRLRVRKKKGEALEFEKTYEGPETRVIDRVMAPTTILGSSPSS